MVEEHPVFPLKLEKTYYNGGYFNVKVTHDRFVRNDEGPVSLVLKGGQEIPGHVHRTANGNGTARVRGNVALREWFQQHYQQGDTVPVTFESATRLRLG